MTSMIMVFVQVQLVEHLTFPMSLRHSQSSYKPLSCHTGRRLRHPVWMNNGYTGSRGEDTTKLPE
jgi:hypothetical protein